MSTTTVIKQDQDTQFDITGSGNTWILKKGVTIDSPAKGIYEAAGLKHNTFIINGDVSSNNGGLQLEGRHATVEISETGALFGINGVATTGNHAEITNAGSIQGTSNAIEIHGDQSNLVNDGEILSTNSSAVSIYKVDTFTLENNGSITGYMGIVSDADHLTIRLGKHSDVSADITGIRTLTILGESADITNQGTLAANGDVFALAIEGGLGRETVRNSGHIDGSLSLGDGRDRFDGRGGSVTGVINGGLGDDIYTISNKNDYVYEATGEGFDKLKVSCSYTLPQESEIEDLRLAGKSDFKLLGNDLGNYVTGNLGDNKLFGMGEADHLFGGKGNDILAGGEGSDAFFFKHNADKEIITDFTDGQDLVWFLEGKDITSINDLLKHHTEQHGDDLVISGDGTEMIIRNFDKADFDAFDFVA